MTSLEDRAGTLLRRAIATIDNEQYFDAAPNEPDIKSRGQRHTITILIHVGILDAERLLTKGPLWRANRKHPYIKVEQVWLQNELIRYVYQLSDSSYGFEEGFHYHVETDSGGVGVYHYTRKMVGTKGVWRRMNAETPLATALTLFVDSIWQLRS